MSALDKKLRESYRELRQEGLSPEDIGRIIRIYFEGKLAGKADAGITADMRAYLDAKEDTANA